MLLHGELLRCIVQKYFFLSYFVLNLLFNVLKMWRPILEKLGKVSQITKDIHKTKSLLYYCDKKTRPQPMCWALFTVFKCRFYKFLLLYNYINVEFGILNELDLHLVTSFPSTVTTQTMSTS